MIMLNVMTCQHFNIYFHVIHKINVTVTYFKKFYYIGLQYKHLQLSDQEGNSKNTHLATQTSSMGPKCWNSLSSSYFPTRLPRSPTNTRYPPLLSSSIAIPSGFLTELAPSRSRDNALSSKDRDFPTTGPHKSLYYRLRDVSLLWEGRRSKFFIDTFIYSMSYI